MAWKLRPFTPGDLQGCAALLWRALPTDPIPESRLVRQVLLDPNFRAEGAVVAVAGAEVVGFCLAIARQTPLENAPTDDDRGYITLFAVLPELQRQGIGSALIDQAEAYLRSENRKTVLISPYAPGYFTPGVDTETSAVALQFLQHRGYLEAYQAISMEAPLWSGSVPARVEARARRLEAEGVVVRPFEGELALPLLEFTRREFPGDWVRVVRETGVRIIAGDSPRRLLAACSGEQVLGFVHHENERFGPIGVAAAERGRGIGQVLMFAALRAMREAGFRSAWFLWSDERTARRLYDSAGFQVVRRFAILRKDLVSG